jgi:hypothetical protein
MELTPAVVRNEFIFHIFRFLKTLHKHTINHNNFYKLESLSEHY